MEQTSDRIFSFTDCNGKTGSARLRVWEGSARAPVAIVSEIEGNGGMSVTNAADIVWSKVWNLLERPADIVQIEHYGLCRDAVNIESTFDRVVFIGRGRFDDADWRRMSHDELQTLIGMVPV